ncbi:MAG: hypothetical protein AAFY41_09465, partial [Bacteroidota bacterium]
SFFTLFATANRIQSLAGILTTVNASGNPVGRKVVFIKEKESSFEKLEARQIDIGSKDYHELERKHSGLAKLFTGWIGNNVQSIRQDNYGDFSELQFGQNYAEVYFLAACRLADMGSVERALELLTDALSLGFDKQKQFNKELSQGGSFFDHRKRVEQIIEKRKFYLVQLE